MGLNASSGIQFNNIPVAAPTPAGIQFAAEGLAVEGGDTVVIGKQQGTGGYPTLTNYRTINAGFNCINLHIDEPGFLANAYYFGNGVTLDEDLGGGNMYFANLGTQALHIYDSYNQAQLSYNTGSPRLDLQASPGSSAISAGVFLNQDTYGGIRLSAEAYDTGAGVDLIDSMVLLNATNQGTGTVTGMRFGIDGGGLPGYYGFGFKSVSDPVIEDVFLMDGRDTNTAAEFIERASTTRHALTVTNTAVGGNGGLLVRGDTGRLAIQATAAANAIAREDYLNNLGAVQASIYWAQTNNVFTLEANDFRIRQSGLDRLRVAQNFIYLNTRTLVGNLSGSANARLHIQAQIAAANTAPLLFDAGAVLMTTPQNGAFEFDGTNLYFTVGGVRKIVSLI